MTNPLIRLAFGIQILDEKSTHIVVSGSLGTSPPPLTGIRRSDSWTFSQSYYDYKWEVDLDPGDYIIRLEPESWTSGVLEISAQLTLGQLAPRFVYWGNLPESSTDGLAGWIETSATVDPPTTSTIGNPKDPVPPPPPPAKRSTVTPSGAVTWFSTNLGAIWYQACNDMRSGAPGSGGPPPPRRH